MFTECTCKWERIGWCLRKDTWFSFWHYNSTYQQAQALEVTNYWSWLYRIYYYVNTNFLDCTIILSLHQRGHERTSSIFSISRIVQKRVVLMVGSILNTINSMKSAIYIYFLSVRVLVCHWMVIPFVLGILCMINSLLNDWMP